MSTAAMMERIAKSSPRLKARIAGGLYLIIIVAAIFAEFFVRGRLVASGDAAATATSILAHETLFRLGFAAELKIGRASELQSPDHLVCRLLLEKKKKTVASFRSNHCRPFATYKSVH